jgi:AcrR family transcriptional regulator
LEAAKEVLRAQGYAGLSTRGVAALAEAPMSQIQYHFGSKEGMVLALFEYLNAQLLERQNALFADSSLTLSEKWDLACDYLDDDFASGYVRVLQELLAAGWANPEIGRVVRAGLMGWSRLLSDLVRTAPDTYGSLGLLDPEDIAALVATAFIGSEAFLLLGLEEEGIPVRRSLRRFGDAIRLLEGRGSQGRE